MATNLALDPDLLDEVLEVSGEKTKKDAVTLALREFVDRRTQAKVSGFFGLLEWDDTFDYKAARRSS
jgi:Arc/MetJ family transcription regulator